MTAVTVLTPAYNRVHLLPRLYDSLVRQTFRDFVWLVVDDGSTDGTEAYMRDIQGGAPFAIRYIKKPNGGRHTAVNLGVSRIDTELTFIVDSDDTLTPDAVEQIVAARDRYCGQEGLSGFCFLKGCEDGTVLDGLFPQPESIGNYIRDRLNKGMWGDKAEVYYTRVLREFPFPEFPGERFISEDVAWIPMAARYDVVQINRVIYLCDYLEDGLTKNGRAMKMSSPRGGAVRARQLMDPHCCLKIRMKGALLYDVYTGMQGVGFAQTIQNAPGRLLAAVMYPASLYLRSKWQRDIRH
ncbi:glycosyltransferase family A protein [Gemmiger sp. An120]|uniref:glycosyltransferase family A protein n=1 Tax=Gemmiger sp. An120 TaxID=1965549 RepID=UPI00130211E9|nr:glycosyltransferase family A protein [Gemmiger sp. An120]